jgi:hypothetical protein
LEDLMSRSVRPPAVLAAALTALVAMVALTGCGSDDPDGSGASGGSVVAKPDSSGTPTVDVTFEGDTVKPQGASVEVEAGKPLKLHITADEPGEIHVHSTPEQEIEYDAGTSDKTLTLDQPGVVDVESHDLDKLIIQVEVR